jgi:hypothetical protein
VEGACAGYTLDVRHPWLESGGTAMVGSYQVSVFKLLDPVDTLLHMVLTIKSI